MGLKDFFGRFFKEAAKPETRQLGAVSLAERWSTYPSVGLTPNRLAEIFREADLGDVYRQMELFEEMEEKDAHLASLLQTRKLAVLSKDYEILPYSKNSEDQAIAGFVGEVVYGSPTWRRPCWTCWTASARGSPCPKSSGTCKAAGLGWRNSSGSPRKR